MEIQERIIGTVAVLTLHGRMMSKPDVTPFGVYVRRLMDNGVLRVVVDLSGVRWLSAAMLGGLVQGLKVTRQVGGDLRLAEMTRGAMRVLEVTQLSKVFWIEETVDQAVVGFVAQDQANKKNTRQMVARVQAATRSSMLRFNRREVLSVAV